MACDRIDLTEIMRQKQRDALDRLRKQLAAGTATVVISANGALAFRGWTGDRSMLFDACAYRKLVAANSPELRRAIARAEALSGRKLNPAAINAGVHSHDGGMTWGTH
jgi:hypothetical protein